MWRCTNIYKCQVWLQQQKHYLRHLKQRHHLKRIDSAQFLKSQHSNAGWHSDSWLCEGCDAGLAVPFINNNNNDNNNYDNRPNFESTTDCDKKMQKDTTTNSANSNTSININIFDANDESLQKRDKNPLKLSENPPDSDIKTDNGVGVMCPSCNWSETLVEVERVEGALEVHLEKLPMDNNEEGRLMAEEILSRWEAAKLHPHHHILMAAKRKVALSPAGLGTLGNQAN